MKQTWRKKFLPSALTIGMVAASLGFGGPGGGGITAMAAEAPDRTTSKTIAEIDFSEKTDLNSLNGWTVSPGGGTAELVEDEGNNALKLTKPNGGNTELSKTGLGIDENEYRYVSVTTVMKAGTEDRANQFSLPYLSDSNGGVAYTMYVDGDWSQFKTHVNGKNVKTAGTAKPGQWQTVRMDIDLKDDTFRVMVDGEYELVNEAARSKVTNLNTIRYYADSWNQGTVYFRSVKVEAFKERSQSGTFYVSSEGDDSADGTTPETAWKTVARVNKAHFLPGDQILFERGGEWNETLAPQGSGTAGNMITISSYGEGALPKIKVDGASSDALYLYNQEYWEISNLDISNTVPGFRMLSGDGTGDGTAPTGNVTERNNEDGSKLGDYRGIHIAGRDVPTLKGFWLHDLLVHDVTGYVSWIGDTGLRDAGIKNSLGLDGSKRTGGVLFECLKPTGNVATQFSDIVIEKSQFINNSFCGITVKQWNGSGNQYGNNPGWANKSGQGSKPNYTSSHWKPHSNIIIQDNYINQGASAYACNGIYLTSSRDSVIQRNVLEHIGTCGIELYFTDNVAVQFNEVSDVAHKGGGQDSNAIDPDWMVTNALIQYNYVHDCGEGFLLCGVAFNSGVIRYNLVQDCRFSYVHYSMGSGYFQIYNNVFYRSKDGSGTSNFDPWGGGKVSYVNNVFYDGKGTGFGFSGSSSFAFDNNAYYGTAAPSKDKNPLILTEDPFEGEAPNLARKGSAETGPLLEANGLRPKMDSPLIGAGVMTDPLGINLDNGLKSAGTEFNFSALDKADNNFLGDCINIGRADYPTFENTGEDGVITSAKSQKAADTTAPTIGMFEVSLPAEVVILRGNVNDGANNISGAVVEVTCADKTVAVTTDESGNYSIKEGLGAGAVSIKVSYGEDGSKSVENEGELKAGVVNIINIQVPLDDMPETYEETLINESFDAQTDPANFGFNWGTNIADGQLVLTTGMGRNTSAVKTFDADIASRKGADITFDWKAPSGNKMGFEFRDDYGRLVFGFCTAPGKKVLRASVEGAAVDDGKAATDNIGGEPKWTEVPMDTNKTYTIRIHGDFETQTLSYQIREKDSKTVVLQKLDLPIEGTNLSRMIACSWWDSQAQYIDNFVLTAPADDLPLSGKNVYAFGDSIVEGHEYKKAGFASISARHEGMELTNYGKNGATMLDANYMGGQILKQVQNAPQEAPDYVLFDGGTNDAEYLYKNNKEAGTVAEGKEPESFDTNTFAGAFENTVYTMKQKWPEAQLVYVAVHKLGSRDWETQERLHKLEMDICGKWGIAVADVYTDAELDTRIVDHKDKYSFNGVGKNGLPGTNGSGTHPNLDAVREFYIPVVTEALRNPENHIPEYEAPKPADKTALTEAIKAAKEEAEKSDLYTEESLAKLKEAVAAAQKVVDDGKATDEDVSKQVESLKAAVESLVKKEVPADKTALTEAIKVAKEEADKTDIYTEESLAKLTAALEAAEKVAADDKATQEEVDQQTVAVKAAVESLEKKEVPVEPEKPADKTALTEAIKAAKEEADKTDLYTQESLAKLTVALEVAEKVAADEKATQEEVDQQTAAVKAAVESLEKKEVPVEPEKPADKTSLMEAIKAVKEEVEKTDLYTEESLAKLTAALEAAEKVAADEKATQEEVDKQTAAVKAAVENLEKKEVPVDPEKPADKTALTEAIKAAKEEADKTDLYTEESLEKLTNAIEAAEKVATDEKATQEEVEKQTETIKAAIESLEEKEVPEETEKPEKPEEPQYFTTKITVTRKPDRTDYLVGDDLDPEGLEVTAVEKATASNASRERKVPVDELEFNPDHFEEAGDTAVTVTYTASDAEGDEKEFTAQFTVKVEERLDEDTSYVTKIVVAKKPKKLNYMEGEDFDPEGMEVEAVLRSLDGKKTTREQISLDALDFEYDFSQPGSQRVKITYMALDKNQEEKAFHAEVQVMVAEKVEDHIYMEGIKITQLPKRMSYTAGEKFDPDGMVVTAYRKNTATGETIEEEITDYQVDIQILMAAGSQKVTVTYVAADEDGHAKAFTDSITVTVQKKQGILRRFGSSGKRIMVINDNKIPLDAMPQVTAGTWQRDEKGWIFRKEDGTYVTDGWVLTEWNQTYEWYLIDTEGYMVTGWVWWNGDWYYLHTASDGTQGHMYTGWKMIDGRWYFFQEVSDGKKGAMLHGATTPDGYKVDENGVWVK